MNGSDRKRVVHFPHPQGGRISHCGRRDGWMRGKGQTSHCRFVYGVVVVALFQQRRGALYWSCIDPLAAAVGVSNLATAMYK